MPRKGIVAKRDVLPDPIYNSKLVTRLINKIMLDGKRGTAQTILYNAFNKIEAKTGKPAMEVFEVAIGNIMPALELKTRRVGAANVQVPVEVSAERRVTLGLRWLVNYARLRNEKSMEDNNSSSFCYRKIVNTNKLSKHALGLAIDINPLYNPYVVKNKISPVSASVNKNRSQENNKYIKKGDVIYNAFTKRGWTWGGDWKDKKDYQHFEKDL